MKTQTKKFKATAKTIRQISQSSLSQPLKIMVNSKTIHLKKGSGSFDIPDPAKVNRAVSDGQIFRELTIQKLHDFFQNNFSGNRIKIFTARPIEKLENF